MVRSLLPAGLLAAAWALFTPATTLAQGQSPYIPPDVKGFGALQIRQSAIQHAARLAPTVVSSVQASARQSSAGQSTEVSIRISVPGNWNPPASVLVEGPEGEVRTFAVEGGREALQSRVVVVRPGERVIVQLTPAGARIQR